MDALISFTQQALQDSQKAISALNAEQAQIRTGYLSHAGLLQTGLIGYVALTYGHGFPLVG